MKEHPKPLPPLRSDVDAEHFVDTADLSEYDLSDFKPMRFEIEPKAASLNMRLPPSLLKAVKARAKASGVPYTRYVRMLLEADVAQHR
jgi:predicted DNA binding CopG/RHH family protein